MSTKPTLTLLLLTFAMNGLAQDAPDAGAAGSGAVVANKEYFIQQTAGEAMVLKVGAFEAAFAARLTTDDGTVLAESGLPDARMLPLFQFVNESDSQRQLDIDVLATQVTSRTEFELELIRLNIRDQRSAEVATAYQLLSVGLELLPDGNAQAWPVKIQTLMQAGRGFDEIGMREMRLWCSVYAGHLVLYGMRDYQTAIDWANELLSMPRIERFPEIQFAATRIRSFAMLAVGTVSGGLDPANSPLQKALAQTAKLAHDLDYRYEEARTLEAAGVDLQKHGLYGPALEKLQHGLAIAEEIGAGDLAAAIREPIVEILEVTGDSEASGNVLQDIESHLVETGEQEELAQNLLRQGRLYIDSSRYDSAIEVLSRGVGLEQSSLTLLQGELALGTALNQAGRSSEALVHLDRAARISPGGDFRQPSSVLDLASALDQISDIHRQQANFQQMNEARLAQRRYLRDAAQQAEWAYERGIDASMQSGFDSLGAFDQFRAAHRLAESSGENLWLELSRLRLCAINQIRGRGDPLCQSGNVRKAYDTLVQTGTGRQAAEAALAYTRLLELNGQATNAFEVANNQVGGLLENGHASLGAWYWQWREALFSQYLSLAIGIEGQAGSNDASRSLLALARARAVERSANATAKAPEVSGLSQFLRDLPADAAVLSYYIFEDSAYAWLGRGSGVQRIQLSGASQIRSQCAELRDIIQSGGWTGFDRLAGALGKSLLEPVEDDLPSMVYFVGQGDLLGIPVDSLLLDGEPLATRRQVINLDRFPGSPETFGRTKIPTLSTVFLAGDPVDWSGEFASRLESSGEMKIVTERFVGPGLRSIQGVSLLLDEFTDSHYGEADLVHLAVPGIVDLSTAHGSGLFLSEPARGAGRQRLEAEALELMPLNADLVFFSRSEFSGTATAVESDLGFISSALAAGAGAVIASLWPVEAETRERFVAGFYDRLLDDRDAATALALTKSDTLSSLGGHDWASFQLFLN